MKNIEVTNFKGNKYEGSWNEKTYSSNIADHPDLYRIYVNDQAIHITEKEYNEYVKKANEFINSEMFYRQFSIDAYVKRMIALIE